MFFFIPIQTLAIASSPVIAGSSDICTFTKPTDGNLVTNTTMPTKLESFSAVGGLPTRISVSCHQPVQLTVSAPIQVAGPAFNPVSSLAIVESPTGRSTNSRSNATLPLPVGTTPLLINLSVDKGSLLKPGNYKYGVRFSIVP